ncbi:cytochrome b/b6 domain-containing protein [Lichenifustis flavocetrariae]|uniref:Cytochrome b/b6 domain-containing protein n=1 Tax=Lichenifustis flavocetrariae TaxID=2949735 RepID=A0AA42CJJ8_9HYPH|nr:cytochrome b/b6 domain-containing protein [Lichenifustis flavocetrariae]MCW6509648.1 cytochrome b/b6 domain-containing protein [Lichenifustis flavocetrariae]
MSSAETELDDPVVANDDAVPKGKEQRLVTLLKRHSVVVRVTHWITVLCLTMLLMSGLQIFNARPQLDFGIKTDFDHPPVAIDSDKVDGRARGYVRIGEHRFDTTGVLGLSTFEGKPAERAFPSWATLPGEQDLGTGRAIHFVFAWLFVANGLVYLVWGFATRHFRRDFLPSRTQWRHIGGEILDHARLRFPQGEKARQYNAIQKITYFSVVFVLLPLLVVAGWTMSPGLDAAFPFLLHVFGGRQTARSVHFLAAFGVVLFVVVHVALVLLSGLFNNMRSMVTGWYDIGQERGTHG